MKRAWSFFSTMGMGPALLMVTLQVYAADVLKEIIPVHAVVLTFFGTSSIYILDRLVERRSGLLLESRHELSSYFPYFILLSGGMAGIWFIVSANLSQFLWLGLLGAGGCLYLAVTSGRIKGIFFGKEALGSLIFAGLILGLLPFKLLLFLGFLLLGLCNFLWSGYFDRSRDIQNQIMSVAVSNQSLAVALARVSGIISFLFFTVEKTPYLAAVALLHAFWPKKWVHIDLAFLPVIAWLFPFFWTHFRF